jgi:hypothetical protein
MVKFAILEETFMSKHKSLASLQRARMNHRKVLFVAKLDDWARDGAILKRMPTLKRWLPDLELILRRFGLTDEHHIAVTGRPWPRRDVSDLEFEQLRHTVNIKDRLPHVSDVKGIVKLRDLAKDIEDSVAHIDRISIDDWHKLKPVQQAALSRRGVFPQSPEELTASTKSVPAPIAIDFDAFEQGKNC